MCVGLRRAVGSRRAGLGRPAPIHGSEGILPSLPRADTTWQLPCRGRGNPHIENAPAPRSVREARADSATVVEPPSVGALGRRTGRGSAGGVRPASSAARGSRRPAWRARARRRSGPALPADGVLVGDDGVASVERRVALGVVERRCAPRLSVARERAARDQPGKRMRVLQQPREALRVAHDAGVAPTAPRAWSARRTRARAARAAPSSSAPCGASGGGAGCESACSTARRANTKHSLSEFEARRLAPCRPVQDGLADRIQPRRRSSARAGR